MADRNRAFEQRQNVTGRQETPSRQASGADRENWSQSGSTQERDLTDEAPEKAGQAREMVDHQRERASHGMESAADQMREHADQIPGGQRTSDIANQAADRVEDVAHYIADRDMSVMISDLEQVVRDHPKESLIAAAAAGFLVGRALRS